MVADALSFRVTVTGTWSDVFVSTVELQWLEHRWLVYHGYFELVLESLGKNPIAADIIIFGIIRVIFFSILNNVMFCVLLRIASMRRF